MSAPAASSAASPSSPSSGLPRVAVVLAGERPGGNALARAYGLESSLLVELNGRPVIDWTLSAIEGSSIESMVLLGPGASVTHPVLEHWRSKACVEVVEPGTGPAASAVTGARKANTWPVLLTAADHGLLTSDLIDEFCKQAQSEALRSSADFVVGLVDAAAVRQRFPDSRRTWLKFSDGACCGSNLFYLATPAALDVLLLWSRWEALRKTPWKIAWGMGLVVCVRYLLGNLSVGDAFAALSARAGASVSFCKLTEPELAVDVDSVADLDLACTVLRERDR